MIRLLSGDGPRSWILGPILLAILIALAGAPFLFEGVRALDTAARICIFIVLVASYDLLLGYAGIVSFAHTMFFGLGAYGVALSSIHMGRGWDAVAVGTLAGALAAAVLAAVIGVFSLRVRAVYFAMITLAVASAVAVLVSQFPAFTGGEDGVTFQIPRDLTPARSYGETPLPGLPLAAIPDLVTGETTLDAVEHTVRLTGNVVNYYLIFGVSLVLFLIMLRIVNSPFGTVLKAIRENDFRAEAIGYSVVRYRIAVTIVSAVFAALAGSLFALWLRHVGPDTTLSFEIMIDILLMVVIGGMGTMWGPVIGVTLFLLAQGYLRDLMGVAAEAAAGVPLLPQFLEPDRWLLWLGVLFILSVHFFPGGIVGRLRGAKAG